METKLNLSNVRAAMEYDIHLMMRMWQDSYVQMYQDEELPESRHLKEHGAIFLLGPTSRNQFIELNWRKDAVAHLRGHRFRGYIFVPENRGGYGRDWGAGLSGEFDAPKWETDRWLRDDPKMKDVKLATLSWIPRDLYELLGLNTNWEEGHQTGGVDYGAPHEGIFIGWPEVASRMKLPTHYLDRMEKKGWDRKNNFSDSLERLCEKVCQFHGIDTNPDPDDDIPF